MRLLFVFLATLVLARAQTVDALLVEADALDAKNQNREALALLFEADRHQPGQAETLRRIAKQYDQLSLDAGSKSERKTLNQQSLDAALRAVRSDPKNARARLCLAIVYGRNANFEAPRRKVELSRLIKEEAEAAARLDPRQDYAWHILGRWNYELANFNPVLKALAQTIYGKFPEASNDQAAAHFQKAIALQPRRVMHHIELGRTYLALGEKEKARLALEAGLRLPAVNSDEEDARQRGREALRQLP